MNPYPPARETPALPHVAPRTAGTGTTQHLLLRLRRHWYVVALLAVLTAATGYWLSSRADAMYESSSRLVVKGQNLYSEINGNASNDQNRVVATQAGLVTVADVVSGVMRRNSIPAEFRDELVKRTVVSSAVDSDILTISVRWTDPQTSMNLSDSFAQEFVAYRARLDTSALVDAEKDLAGQIERLRAQGDDSGYLRELLRTRLDLQTRIAVGSRNTEIVERALEAKKVAPRPLRSAVLTGALGAFLGAILVALLSLIDTPLRDVSDIAEAIGAPVLATVPAAGRGTRGAAGPQTVDDPRSPQAEAYRLLAASLALTNIGGRRRAVLITSDLAAQGKTSTAANLAFAAARAGTSVVAVDCDLRKPRLAVAFGCPAEPGMVNVVATGMPLTQALVSIDDGDGSPSVDLLPSGPVPPNPGDLVMSEALATQIRALRAEYELVVVDGPPWLVAADALGLTRCVDGVVVAVRWGHSRRRSLGLLREGLHRSGCPVLGCVIIGGRRGGGGYGDYGAYGGYGDEAQRPRDGARSAPPS